MGSGYFVRTVCDCGEVRRGGVVSGKFVGVDGMEIRGVDGGCLCGGKPRIVFEVVGKEIRFRTEAKILNGKRVVYRVVKVDLGGGRKQILWIKYKVL